MELEGATAEPAPQNKLTYLNGQAQDVLDKMEENIKGMIEQGVKTNHLLDRAESLEHAAKSLQVSGQKLATSYRCKNIKLILVIVVVTLVIILIIVLLATGVIPAGPPLTSTANPTSRP